MSKRERSTTSKQKSINPYVTMLNRDGPAKKPDNGTRTQRDPQPKSSTPTRPPMGSTKEEVDTFMTSRQPKINELPPEEKKEQDEWARGKLQETMSGVCNMGYKFIRVESGYVCCNAGHYIPNHYIGTGWFYHIGFNSANPGRKLLFGPFPDQHAACYRSGHPGWNQEQDLRDFPDVQKVKDDRDKGRYDMNGRKRW